MKLPTPPKAPAKKTALVKADSKKLPVKSPKKPDKTAKQPDESTDKKKKKDENALDVWNDEAKTLSNIGGG